MHSTVHRASAEDHDADNTRCWNRMWRSMPNSCAVSLHVLQNGRPAGDGLRLFPGPKGIAEREHVRIRPKPGVAEQVPGAAEIVASLRESRSVCQGTASGDSNPRRCPRGPRRQSGHRNVRRTHVRSCRRFDLLRRQCSRSRETSDSSALSIAFLRVADIHLNSHDFSYFKTEAWRLLT